jgi:hypothetical protein
MDLDELVEHWTLLEDERELAGRKRGATRLGFALLLRFYARAGRFPRGRSELAADAVEFVARQVDVPASDLGFYEWSGRTFEYHRAQVRRHLGFRECSAKDGDKLAAWLAANVCQAEQSLTLRVAERLGPDADARLAALAAAALAGGLRPVGPLAGETPCMKASDGRMLTEQRLPLGRLAP